LKTNGPDWIACCTPLISTGSSDSIFNSGFLLNPSALTEVVINNIIMTNGINFLSALPFEGSFSSH